MVLSLRVIMRRLSVGTTLAWVALLFLVPLVGAILYLIFGDIQLGARRAARAAALTPPYQEWLRQRAKALAADLGDRSEQARVLNRHIYRTLGMPTVSGNRLEVLDEWKGILEQWVEEIDGAESHVFMEFYIWYPGGLADAVLEACMRAARRGVTCRILLDSVGSDRFLKSAVCSRARHAGLEITEALPAGVIKGFFQRQDIRMHRKVVVIDGRVGYTGSLNLADAGIFKQSAGVGQWVDVMVRIEGPGVSLLSSVFMKDWLAECGQDGAVRFEHAGPEESRRPGRVRVQPVPSGPGFFNQAIYQTLLTAIFSSRNRMILTTPYFVPDDPISAALATAARRGVEVILVVPERIDSHLVEYASRSHFEALLEAGVRIARFRGGLLHAKTITIDDDVVFIGSVNLDQRSFWINYEITLLVYDAGFRRDVEALQRRYLETSTFLDLERWKRRPFPSRLYENVVRLLSPLL